MRSVTPSSPWLAGDAPSAARRASCPAASAGGGRGRSIGSGAGFCHARSALRRSARAPRRTAPPPDGLRAGCHDAGGGGHAATVVADLPFRLRPGLVAEILRFYDHLRRQSQQVERFEELIERGARTRRHRHDPRCRAGAAADAVSRGSISRVRVPRGRLAARATSTQLRDAAPGRGGVAAARARSGHGGRLDCRSGRPVRRRFRSAVAGCRGFCRLDLVCTDAVLGSGFHERLHGWWPGLEEVEASRLWPELQPVRPHLLAPPSSSATPGDAPLWFTYRDREEELTGIAQVIAGTAAPHDACRRRLQATAAVSVSRAGHTRRSGDSLADERVAPARRRTGGQRG